MLLLIKVLSAIRYLVMITCVRNTWLFCQNSIIAFCFFSNRMGSSWQNGYFPVRCLHVWCTRHFSIQKPIGKVQERVIYWWNRAESKSRDGQKERGRILEAVDRFGQDVVHFGDTEVGLISDLAIITKVTFIFCRFTQ